MLQQLDITPADVSAASLGVRWNADLPPVLAEMLIDAHTTTLHLAVIGGSHVVTVEAPSGRFREEVSCHAAGPLPLSVDKRGYTLRTDTSTLDFERRAAEIAARRGWLIASFPGEGPHHLTALAGEFDAGTWTWWTHHLYPREKTIVSTRSTYRP
ncbi:DUF2617 family protein [Corynebacterium pacaense]|uniref:DUF2617 family protein n=1 Tax=Corynebacterium pacaense TaxID=1816684 RepID=UPI0009BB217F|nr:DUF2617 family protein [Corynebacterium pacaense]